MLYKIDVSIAMATGYAYCGNIGTHNLRSFSIIGNVHAKCNALLAMNEMYGIRVSFEGSILHAAQKEFNAKPLCVLVVGKENGKNDEEQFDSYELVFKGKNKGDGEWMYELDRETESQAWTELQEAFQLCKTGAISDGMKKIQKYISMYPKDTLIPKIFETVAATRLVLKFKLMNNSLEEYC